jgi:hypothetical protein
MIYFKNWILYRCNKIEMVEGEYVVQSPHCYAYIKGNKGVN